MCALVLLFRIRKNREKIDALLKKKKEEQKKKQINK